MEKLTQEQQEQLEQIDVIVGKGNGYILMTFGGGNMIFNCNRVNLQNIMQGQCKLEKIIEDKAEKIAKEIYDSAKEIIEK